MTNINLADHALKIGEPGEAQKILEQVHPSLADRDYRGFEWHLLSEMARKAPSSLGFHKGDAYGSDLSPDRRLLATCGQDGIRIWNLSTGQEVRELTDHNSDVNGVSFSPNGLWIASASDDRTVRIWSTEDWSCLHVISHDVEVVNAVFSPDSRLLATGERLSKGTDGQEPKAVIRFWKAGSWEQVGDDLSGHSKDLQVITFNDNGTLLASASSDGTACVWDVESRSLRHRLKCSSPNDNYAVVSCVAFAHQRPFVATVGGAGLAGYVQIWNLNDGSPVTKLPGSEQDIQGVVFSPDDSLVAACGNENLVYGWKIRPDGTHTDNVVSHATSRVWSVNFLNATDVVTTEKDGAVRRRRLFSRSQEKRILSSSRTAPVFEFYPDGDTLVVANGGLAIHSISNRIESSQLEPLSAGTKLIAISQDARNLVSFGKDLRIKVRGKDGAVRTSDRLGYDLHSLVFTEHDQHIAAITQRRADFFDPLTLKQASSLTFIERRSSRGIVEASPGGMNYSVLPGNGSLEMWGQQRRLWTIDGIGDVLNPIQFSRDSRQVAICRTDGVIQVWQVSDPKASVTLVGRFNERATLGFSADGRTLGGVYDDGTVKLWNVSTGREMLTLDSKLTIGGRIVFSPRGNAFAVSGKNAQEMYEIVIWKLAPEPDSTAIGK